MSGVKSNIYVITAIFALSGCGKVSEDDARKMDPHQSRFPRMQVNGVGIQGIWESSCQVENAANGSYQKFFYSLVNGQETKKVSYFDDASCVSKPTWQKTYSGEYSVVLDELRQRLYSLAVLPQDQTRANLMNMGEQDTDHFCKSQVAFTVQVESHFPVTDCNEETEQVSKLDMRGDAGYVRELFVDDVRLHRASGEGF